MSPSARKLLLLSATAGVLGATLFCDFVRDRYYLNGTVYNSFLAVPGATYTGGAPLGTLVPWADGSLKLVAQNVPRRSDLGLLSEPAAAGNLVLQSGDMTQAAWTKTRVTSTADATVTTPQGTSSTKVAGAGAAFAYERQIFAAAGSTTYSYQLLIEKGSGVGVVFNLADGTNTWFLNLNTTTGAASINGNTVGSFVSFSAQAKAMANGFWLYTMTATTAAGATTLTADTYVAPAFNTGASPTAADYYRFAFAQCVAEATPTSLIPTTAAAVARAADVASIGGAVIPATHSGVATVGGIASLAGAPVILSTTADAETLYMGSTAGHVSLYGSAVTPHDLMTTNAVAISTTYKAAFRVSATGRSVTLNGAAVTTDAQVPAPGATLWLGSDLGTGQWLNGFLQRVAIYPTAFTDANLQALATA